MLGDTRVPNEDQFVGALLGLAVGDALGRPLEGRLQPQIRTRSRDELLSFHGYRDLKLGQNLPPGAWSDDTQQALVLAESLTACVGLQAEDFSNRMYALWRSGAARGYGRVYQKAMERRHAGQPWNTVAVDDDTYNGASMRITPLGLFYWFDPEQLTSTAAESARITHTHPMAVAGAVALAHAVAYALIHPQIEAVAMLDYLCAKAAALDAETAARLEAVRAVVDLELDAAFLALCRVPDYATPRGAAVSGLTTGLLLTVPYLFLHTRGDYVATVEAAMLLGGDTDGTGGVAGALCAAWAGSSGLPAHLVETVEAGSRIREVAARLHAASLQAAGVPRA